ncbi:S41 family peptidase [Phenylobacterium sp.]|uniref:S41 family peptidase n=1 Tax=Phenylobacterium sp. TaxID=1871053 RepID=UPI002ED82EBD
MKLRTAASLLGAFAMGAATMALVDRPAQAAAQPASNWLSVFRSAFELVVRQHLTPVNEAKAIQAALVGMMRSLDPGSTYYSPEQFAALRDRSNQPATLGVTLERAGGALLVGGIAPNSPAAKGGLKVGDRIVAIDGAPALELLEASSRLVGTQTPVVLTVDRASLPPFHLTLIREVPPPSVTARMIGNAGYLSLGSFHDTVATDTIAAIAQLKAENPAMKGLVLDLRGSPGGLLNRVVDVASIFLDGGEVAWVAERDPGRRERFKADPGDALTGAQLIVLIDAGAASGAEVVAGALQERGRAKIVGVSSHDGGTIQTLFPLSGGLHGALKLTTGAIHLPSGRAIQETGVTPDVVVEQAESGDTQLTRALALLN